MPRGGHSITELPLVVHRGTPGVLGTMPVRSYRDGALGIDLTRLPAEATTTPFASGALLLAGNRKGNWFARAGLCSPQRRCQSSAGQSSRLVEKEGGSSQFELRGLQTALLDFLAKADLRVQQQLLRFVNAAALRRTPCDDLVECCKLAFYLRHGNRSRESNSTFLREFPRRVPLLYKGH